MHSSKTCFKCNKTLPLTEFYQHFAMGDGHLNKCKECTKNDVLLHRQKNIERIRAYDSERAKLPHNKKKAVEVTRRRRKENEKYMRAHNAVARAVKKGELVKTNCQWCGREDNVHGHHDSYDEPLNVMWLCPVCHRKRHDELAKQLKDVF